MKYLGFLGMGTVGTGVLEILNNKKDEIEKITNKELIIKKALIKNQDKERDLNIPRNILTTDPNEILNDDSIDIVIEVMSEEKLAYEYIKQALNSKKHVVSANKAVISKHLKELLNLAKENNVKLLFEASVGGGTPIIKPLIEQSRFNDVNEIRGILNGTTNYILSKMLNDNYSFEDALKLAQDQGYAEADPTADIEGFDVLRKINILSMIAYKVSIKEESALTRGIKTIASADIKMFKKLNLIPKLMAKSFKVENDISVLVEPILIDNNSIFSKVDNSYNMVKITGDFIGNLKFYGQGAGKNPTGNAVVNDILDIITDSYPSFDLENGELNINLDSSKGKYYLRFENRFKNLFDEILGKNNYSVLEEDKSFTYIITDYLKTDYLENCVKKLNSNKIFYAKIEKI